VSDAPRPLHVLVAEALGWECWLDKAGWAGRSPDDYMTDPPNFDTDWSATGPLVERFKISVAPDQSLPGSWGAWVGDFAPLAQRAATPLLAICNLIVALAREGKLSLDTPPQEA